MFSGLRKCLLVIRIGSFGLIGQLSTQVLLPCLHVFFFFFFFGFSNGGFIAEEEKRGRLAEWVENVSFDRIY